MLTHVVFFRMKPESQQRKGELVSVLRAMKEQIDELAEIEVGVDVSRSARSWDAALVTRFRSSADLAAYRVHPDHKKVLELVAEICSETSVVDYEAEE